jgi:hypothetical protein
MPIRVDASSRPSDTEKQQRRKTMIELTEKHRQALRNGEAVRVPSPEIGEEAVLLRGADFARIQMLLEDEREKAAWATVARKAASRWARENPF